ncbi:acylphosphatase [Thermomonas carbonis]|uniref:acylphosphatase n=1 Tax=Thermomonas carbonis TaxID=1463158 RepID=A0A7G9SLZ8_9GAMM|nr:acylphosphatase [Thermomonas carbonis]QNN68873.1 acylphosphatase [Thermomonas carbonis]GHC08145.1 acylphosphatase [Thermomonas carbonis]
MPTARFIVRGKVQGVWFRASTRDEAARLGLSGHARNLADGSVEVLAIGDAAVIDALQRWLHAGPPLARVDTVFRENLPVDSLTKRNDFAIG